MIIPYSLFPVPYSLFSGLRVRALNPEIGNREQGTGNRECPDRPRRVSRCIVALVVLLVASNAAADTLTVGLFAPSAPFESTAARVALVNKLAAHLGQAVGDDGVGRVYGRVGDFAQAIKKGEIQVAVVDAAYVAATGGGAVIAVATRGGDAARAWQIVARGGAKNVLALKGKKLLVPSIGGRESDFVTNALFGGWIGKSFFKLETAPDTASALAALGLGKADAAVVPIDASLPGAVTRVGKLEDVPGAMLVVYGGERRAALAKAAATFRGDGAITGFRADDGGSVKSLARRFSAPKRNGPMAIPNIRPVVGGLVEQRNLVIEKGDVARYAAPIAPPE
jgi:hypothetical protein